MPKYRYFVSYAVNDHSLGIPSKKTDIYNEEFVLEKPITTMGQIQKLEQSLSVGNRKAKTINFQLLDKEADPQPE